MTREVCRYSTAPFSHNRPGNHRRKICGRPTQRTFTHAAVVVSLGGVSCMKKMDRPLAQKLHPIMLRDQSLVAPQV